MEAAEVCGAGVRGTSQPDCLSPQTKLGAGRLMGPKGVAVDRNGHIIVVDNKACCVFIFQPNGKLVARFGSRGTAERQFAGIPGMGPPSCEPLGSPRTRVGELCPTLLGRLVALGPQRMASGWGTGPGCSSGLAFCIQLWAVGSGSGLRTFSELCFEFWGWTGSQDLVLGPAPG